MYRLVVTRITKTAVASFWKGMMELLKTSRTRNAFLVRWSLFPLVGQNFTRTDWPKRVPRRSSKLMAFGRKKCNDNKMTQKQNECVLKVKKKKKFEESRAAIFQDLRCMQALLSRNG